MDVRARGAQGRAGRVPGRPLRRQHQRRRGPRPLRRDPSGDRRRGPHRADGHKRRGPRRQGPGPLEAERPGGAADERPLPRAEHRDPTHDLQAAGPLHHLQPPDRRRQPAQLHRAADDADRPVALRGRQHPRRGSGRPHHLHENGLGQPLRRGDKPAPLLHRRLLRRRLPAGRADRLRLGQQGRPGGARGDPPDRRASPPRGRPQRPHRGAVQALQADLVQGCRLPDEPRAVELDRDPPRALRSADERGGQDQRSDPPLRRLPPGRRPAQLRRADPAPAQGGTGARRLRDRARPALHQPAAPLLGGLAGQDPRGRGDRPTLDLRLDHPGDPGPQVRRVPRPPLPLDRPRRGRHRQAGRGLPRPDGRRLHPGHGGRARRDRGAERRLGRHARPLLRDL